MRNTLAWIIFLMSALISQAGFADTGDTIQLQFDGSTSTVESELRGFKTRTEYRTQYVQTVCYRNEIIGYRNVCTPNGCYSQPVWRTVGYPCTRAVQVPVEIPLYATQAKVQFQILNPSQSRPNELLSLSLQGETLTLRVSKNSGQFLTLKRELPAQSSFQNGVKVIQQIYQLEFVDAKALNEALSVQGLSLNSEQLQFHVGSMVQSFPIDFNLAVIKAPRIGRNTTLFDRVFKSSELVGMSSGSVFKGAFNLAELNAMPVSGRNLIYLNSKYDLHGMVDMNSEQIKLELERSTGFSVNL